MMEVPVTSQYQDAVSVATGKFASATQHFLTLPSASEVDTHSIWKLNCNSPLSTTKSTICSRANRQDARQFVSQVTDGRSLQWITMRIYSTQPSSLMIGSRWIPFQMRKRCTKCALLTTGLCSDLVCFGPA